MGSSAGSDESVNSTTSQWRQQSQKPPVKSNPNTEQGLSVVQHEHQRNFHEIQEADIEFYNSSIEFLNTHHSRVKTADHWANRNKRKLSIPLGLECESSLVSNVLEVTHETLNPDIEPEAVGLNDTAFDAFSAGSSWKDLDQSYSSESDMDAECRSLLSSVDIMLVSSVSSPTRYYDCSRSRMLVKTYLSSSDREFDEMVEFGFPYSSVVEDKDDKDCRFLTLRLTLTPWHARADEAKLYGQEDAEKHVPLKEMVNKFLSRTSAMLSYPPQRVPSQVQGTKPLICKSRRSPEPDHSSAHPNTKGEMSEVGRVASYSQTVQPFLEDIDAFSGISNRTEVAFEIPSIQDGHSMSDFSPKVPTKTRGGFRKDKGFRIMDLTASPPAATSIIRSVRSAENLSKNPALYT
ncbi:hypothetical protein BGZ65_009986 [Modicella reniformis]|uniref:Uncharacterized protein n=1 Tax=Modicella reniformis TaxID=1440133 RepID=A0A9P6IQM0_9FUNG|nr:hypothetical protein BGZ65_009986 [Modicella reniformis]